MTAPKTVVDAIEVTVGLTGAPRQVRDAIERELLVTFGKSAAAAAELTERLLHRVIAEISIRAERADELGDVAVIHLRTPEGEILHGSSYIFEDDDVVARETKLNRVFVDELYDAMRGLTFSEFEKFGARLLREVGARVSDYTRHAGDQGIDFFGEISVGSLLGVLVDRMRLMHDVKLILVGQAKHYPTRSISTAVVRELVGALLLASTSTFSETDLDLFEEIKLKPFSPILALLFTTGEITAGARNLASKAGLIVFSGWQLAVFLADRGIGLVATDHGPAFEEAAFHAWLDG